MKSTCTPSAPATPPVSPELGASLLALATAIGTIEPLFHHVGDLASACRGLANATAMSVIAQHGTNEDRAAAVAHLKGWFEEFGK